MSREHWALHQSPGCPECLRGFREAIGQRERPAPREEERVVYIVVEGDRARVLRAA